MTVTRFAPSPTGRLHVGNLRTALVNWLAAQRADGRFLLRIDDTDRARSREALVEAIRADLAWFGLHPDGEARQSARFDRYEREFARLRAAGRVYPAYETPEELELRRKVLLSRGLPPIYERDAADAPAPSGRAPHWRFKLDWEQPIAWDDGVRGPQRFDPRKLSDPVVRREDGTWLYLLPSVIDDIELGVTSIVRGEDHVTNTAVQLQMFAALGAAPPAFAHLALLVGVEGKLSKRLGSLDVDALRAEGIEPLALACLLARLGTGDPIEPVDSLAALAATFDLARFGRAPARFDLAELKSLNAKLVHRLPYTAVRDRLPPGLDEPTWLAIRPNLTTVAEAADWWQVVEGPVPAPPPEDRAYLAEAAAAAAAIDWDDAPWRAVTDHLKAATGRSGRALFLPLRRALTGREHGPDMAALLPLIGRARALERLSR